MGIKDTSSKVKKLFEEISVIKRDLADEIRKVDENVDWSGNRKAALRQQLRDQAAQELLGLRDQAEALAEELASACSTTTRINYSDPLFLSALRFIESDGANLPASAAEQLAGDFKNRPGDLRYLSRRLQALGNTQAAVIVSSEADSVEMAASLPRRLGDTLFYTLSADPEAPAKLSGLENELTDFVEFAEAAEAAAPDRSV